VRPGLHHIDFRHGFPIAYLIDRWSRRKAIGLMAILWSIATFTTGLAKNFTGVLIPRFFVGLGEAGFVPGGTAMISASYPKEKRGWAMGIFHIAIPLGAAAGVILGGIISVRWGRRFLRSICWEARGGLILSALFPTGWAEAPMV